ncbi:sensor histidine kinase [Streptomyces johnsoniae]|uniref:histidine kinase n=1 Tax=Streptomyces johnsoniae TaxID=3075532 RepID=A0ABU2SA08_9ACTN|nr:sensor domain-containing protein [Streptomyces sp. DSM 41886]MDT0445812.1 sensor domain-containing protein [Streptomyces sp. DSM 41886]
MNQRRVNQYRTGDRLRPGRPRLASPFAPRALAAVLCAVCALPLALLGLVLVLAGLLVAGVLSWTTFGLWLMALTVRGALALGDVQRALTGALLGQRIDRPADIPEGNEPSWRGALGWRRARLTQRDGWRAVGYALTAPFAALLPVCAVLVGYVYGLLLFAHPVVRHWNNHTVRRSDGSIDHVALEVAGVQLDTWPRWLVPMAVGALLLLAAPWLLRVATTSHVLLQRALLGPGVTDDRDRRIRTLEETRAQAVDDAAATLRRIERDLHDGTQARLVGLGVHLATIQELIEAGADPEQVLAVIETARSNASAAVSDLRGLVRGIHPPVLDQGLATALATLVTDGPLPTDLTTALPFRPAPAVESIAYFCAAELLANAAKHSRATRVLVDVRVRGDTLVLTVWDDGAGGALPGAGSGLTGLLARVRTVDGTLACTSPAGGPTTVTVELPARRQAD